MHPHWSLHNSPGITVDIATLISCSILIFCFIVTGIAKNSCLKDIESPNGM